LRPLVGFQPHGGVQRDFGSKLQLPSRYRFLNSIRHEQLPDLFSPVVVQLP
jgi:hypothetical protein